MRTPQGQNELKSPKTVWTHVRNVSRRIHASRPASFYLIFAIIVILALGSRIGYVREDPKRFAFFLTVHFIFFFVVLVRAVLDCAEILKGYFTERERLYRTTLGEKEFMVELGRRVTERRDQ